MLPFVPLFMILMLILQKEHLAIREKKNPDDQIQWNDLKSMKFTRAVSFQKSKVKNQSEFDELILCYMLI